MLRQLMCTFRVDIAEHAPSGAFSDELALLLPMIANDLVAHSGSVIAMSPVGRPFVRAAAAVVDGFR